eukprot:355043-Chlamydomonas_euryale.AAC.4
MGWIAQTGLDEWAPHSLQSQPEDWIARIGLDGWMCQSLQSQPEDWVPRIGLDRWAPHILQSSLRAEEGVDACVCVLSHLKPDKVVPQPC